MIKYASLMVILCGILRSTDLFFRTEMVEKLSVLTIITWEHLINLALVWPVFYIKRNLLSNLTKTDFLLFILIGFGASALGIMCFTEAFHYINPALAILLQKLQPIITIGFGVCFLKEKLSEKFFLWAFIAIISSYFVSFGLVNPFSGEWHKILNGALFALLAAFFWGGGTVWGKILLSKYDQMTLVAMRFMFGFIFTLTIAYTFGQGLQLNLVLGNNYEIITQIFYMAIISGFLATTFFYIGLASISSSLAGILELIFPISSVLIMWVYFNKPLSGVQIIAAIVLFVSMYNINAKQGSGTDTNEVNLKFPD